MGRTLGGCALTVALVAVGAPAYAAPVTDFQMPFPCGQEWTGTTRSSHSPSSKAVDWNRPDDLDDQVVAAAPGEVSVAVPNGTSGYGNWVRITHQNGESSLYAHLKTVAVSVGQVVDQGTLVGTLGSTGNSSGPHLHFEERSSSGVVHPFFDRVAFTFGSTLASANCVDVPVGGNFVGTANAEVAVFRRGEPATFVIRRPTRPPKVVTFGGSADQPVVGDWDGDGRVNVGVRTPLTRTFSLATPTGVSSVFFGRVADLPVAGDWDGDGLWEVGVRRPSYADFRLRAADGTVTRAVFGDADDLPVTGDWDGDGRTDLGLYDQDAATFTLRLVDGDGLAWFASVPFGEPGDLPVTGDWDANGRTDVGVWQPETGTFVQKRAARATAPTARTVVVAFGNAR